MMKILITGCAGFIGSHLADFLVSLPEKEVYGTYWREDKFDNVKHLKNKINLINCDIRNQKRVLSMMNKIRPDIIFHLAAQSFVTRSFREPKLTLETNVIGTFNLLEAIRKVKMDAKTLIACSSAEYGLTYENEIPIKEDKELRPTSPYAVSKVSADMLGYQYHKTYGMKIIRARFFNIIGPRKIFDACSDFSKGIVEIEKGKKKILNVGNLSTVRDFTDVRDCVDAMWLLMNKGKYDVYNICSGKAYKIKDILDILISLSKKQYKKKIKIVQSPSKKRIFDDPIFVGDNSKIKRLGWKLKVPIEKSLEDMLNYWRSSL